MVLICLGQTAQAASPDENARFLAGMPVGPDSALAPFTETGAWQQHSGAFNGVFKRVDERQFSKIRAWSKANLNVHRPTLFYFFSGPDFLYANAFFPNEKTYILAGLEPVGNIPDLAKLPKGSLAGALNKLQVSLKSVLNLSFFKTIDMKVDFVNNPVNGTLPVLYVFLARSGKVIQNVTLIRLGGDGSVHPDGEPDQPKGARGVKITFSSRGGAPQTLYYFGTNLANDGFKKAGFDKFCESFGQGDAFVKSASYLMHSGSFSQVRNFLLAHTAAILQDDTGIPVTFFDGSWDLRPYGVYKEPIALFAAQYQPKLAELFRKRDRSAINFGLGYRWQMNASNLLYAVKTGKAAGPSPANEAAPPLGDEPTPAKAPAPAQEKDDSGETPLSPPAPKDDTGGEPPPNK